MKLANVKNPKYTKKMFKDIAFFTLAEPGAMGVGNLMEFITAEGEGFSLFFSAVRFFIAFIIFSVLLYQFTSSFFSIRSLMIGSTTG